MKLYLGRQYTWRGWVECNDLQRGLGPVKGRLLKRTYLARQHLRTIEVGAHLNQCFIACHTAHIKSTSKAAGVRT